MLGYRMDLKAAPHSFPDLNQDNPLRCGGVDVISPGKSCTETLMSEGTPAEAIR